MTVSNNHRRVNDILLGPLERPALAWLADHMPAWVTPDLCTAIGVIGALGIMVSYAMSRISPDYLWLASIGFIINWFGDSLDGTLARHRHIERPRFGFFIDHTADAFNETMIVLGLGLTPYIRFDLSCLALSFYLLLSVFVFIHMHTVGDFKISFGKVGPTEVRVVMILFNAAMVFGGRRVISASFGAGSRIIFSPYDLILAAFFLIVLFLFVVTLIHESIRLAKADGSSGQKRSGWHRRVG
jgi:archaetidylinositol phosphate synthase